MASNPRRAAAEQSSMLPQAPAAPPRGLGVAASPAGGTSEGPPAGSQTRPVPNRLGKGAGTGRPARKRRPKDIGTDAERAVCRYLQANGWPSAERRALRGTSDAGDITGTPGVCWEVKARGRQVTDKQTAEWLAETETERRNAGADVGVLVVRRPYAAPGAWWAVLTAYGFAYLTSVESIHAAVYFVQRAPVRLLLADAVTLLRAAGYGNPPDFEDQPPAIQDVPTGGLL